MRGRTLGAPFVAFACVAISARAFADEPRADGPRPPPVTEIVVKGSARVIPSTTTQVMNEAFIERTGATNVGQALEQLPALHAATDSRGERVISLQGFSQRQVAVFVDGVPVLVPYDGQLDLSKFPIDMIDRLTVVKGSSATLYGPNGLGGAINLSTRDPRERPWVRARTEGFTNATRTSITASARAADLGALAGASLERVRFVPMSSAFAPTPNEDGGRRNNSDRLAGSVAVKATYELSELHRFVVTAARFQGAFGVPPGIRDFNIRYWRWTDWYSTAIGAGHEYRGKQVETELLAYASFVGNTLDGYDDGQYATQRLPRALHSVYDDLSLGAFHRSTIALARSPIEPKLRTWLGFKRDHHASFDNTNPAEVAVSTNLITAAASAELDPVPRRLRASGGVQLDLELPEDPPIGAAPSKSTGVGPVGSLTWIPAPIVNVTASAALRTRFPTLRERFSTVFGTREPNPGLGPERALNMGLDVVVKPVAALRIAVGVFDSEVRDLITAVIVGPQTEQQQNAGKARLYGAEAQVQWSPSRWLELLVGGLALSAKSGERLDGPVEYRPAQKALAMITVRPGATVAVSGIGRFVGAQQYANPNTGVWAELDSYGLVDARVEWSLLPELRAYVRGQNLFDADVLGRFSFPEAGRQAFIGLVGETPR